MEGNDGAGGGATMMMEKDSEHHQFNQYRNNHRPLSHRRQYLSGIILDVS